MNMKKVGQEMSVFMGLCMSFVLTAVGLITSGHFTLIDFLLNFVISFLLALILGLAIPVRSIVEVTVRKLGLDHEGFRARLLDALITSLIYSPIMTFLMVYIAYRTAVAHGARITLGPMLMKAELICLPVAFVLGFILSPIILKFVLKRNGISTDK